MPKRSFYDSQLTDREYFTQSQESMPRPSKKSSRKSYAKQYKRKMPRVLSLAKEKVHSFIRRTTNATVPINLIPTTGFSVAGLTTSFNLGLYFYQGGFALYNPSVGPSINVAYTYADASSYQEIFDQFRIKRVRVRGYWSNNTSTTSGVTTAVPLIYSAIDFDGGAADFGATSPTLLTYESARVHQAGTSTSAAFIDREFIPTWSISSATNGLSVNGQYLDISTGAAIAQYGMLLQYDPFSATQNTTLGQLMLVVELEYCYKTVR